VSSVRKITIAVPAELLERALAASGESLTATVCTGLQLVAAGQAFVRLRARRGKVRFSRLLSTLRHDRS